jgi:hypothetical protein
LTSDCDLDPGATLTVEDGVEVPLRPVGQMAYHVSQKEHGFQMMRAITMLGMLTGSVGAAGGTLSDFTWKVHKNFEGLDNIGITDSPNIYLNKSKFYPINSNNSSVVAQVMQDPAKYGVEYRPEVAILPIWSQLLQLRKTRETPVSRLEGCRLALGNQWRNSVLRESRSRKTVWERASAYRRQ